MHFFLKKEVQSFVNSSGRKRTAFYIGEGAGDKIYEIRGITSNNNDDSFNIQASLKSRNQLGRVVTQHKVFKLKKAGINNLLSHSKLKLVKDDSKEKMMSKSKEEYNEIQKMKNTLKPKKKVATTEKPKKAKKIVKAEKSKKSKEEKPKKKVVKKKVKEEKPKKKTEKVKSQLKKKMTKPPINK